jgi:tetratricopeptide (TPR) repeat protein
VLDIQRELGMAIASRVRLRLSPERVKAVSRQQTGNAEAYDLYLRGRYFWNQLSPPTTKRAIEFYTRAAQSDPGYALPWSGLADAYSTGPISGDAPPLTVWPLAQEAAARAVETASDLAETQTSLGFLKFWLDWDWSAAEAAFRQAIALNPSYALAHRMLGITLSHMGRRGESLQAAQTARELDPLNVSHHALSSQIAFAARDYATAAQFARRAIAIAPGFWIGYFQLGQVLEQMGETEAALQALASAARLSEGNSKAIALRGYILARSGRTNEAEKIVRDLEAVSEAASGNRYVPPYAFALVHAGLGNRARSLKWLECACDGHDVHLTFLTVDPKWDFLRSDRRFVAILNRCGFGKAAMGEKQVL